MKIHVVDGELVTIHGPGTTPVDDVAGRVFLADDQA